ncbi:MAG TPA: sulfurtransferase TusA family protein [Anaerolineales bacterium]|nr:sulfurtransferase TusA family protein [Anaerolineales bacterium]
MNKNVDARGLSCPQPVILSQKAIQGGEFPIEVFVDTVTSRENVRRMAERLGCKVEVVEIDDEFKLIISR